MDTVYSMSPDDGSQNGAQNDTQNDTQNGAQDPSADLPADVAFAQIVVRPLQASDEAPQTYALTGQTISIGRSPSCEIVLENDQLTSRRHALLRYDGAHYTVVDLGSSNGTFVNNNEIRDATSLNNGDHIIIGEHELTYSTDVTVPAQAAGVDLNSAPPSSPLRATGAPPVMGVDQQQVDSSGYDTAEAETASMAAVAAPAESAPSAVADTSNVAESADGGGVQDIADMSTNTGLAAIADTADTGKTVDAPGTAVPASGVTEQPISAPMPEPSTPDSPQQLLARAPSSGALRKPGGELDQLRDQLRQLAATSEAVAQHAAEETDLSEQRRQALAETRDQIHAILAGIQNASSSANEAESDDTGDLNDLITLTKQTADDPNHLQNISRMAEHASEIAKALEAFQARRIKPPSPSPTENALEELRALQARLDELA